jgi:DNA repair exonuclease SbcCD nuclease subunit
MFAKGANIMVKFIHTGDVHIGMEFKKASFGIDFAKKRRNEIKETFYNIVKRAGDNKVHLLLISGDLFEDEYITIGDLKELNNQFTKIIDTKVIIIAGNHDPIIGNKSNYSLINWSNNVHIINTEIEKLVFEDIGVDIYGLSWNKKQIKDNLLNDIQIEDKNKINILLAHGDIYQQSNYLPIDKNNLIQKGFDYVALGHIHKSDFIADNIAYCGSPEPLDFSESDKHGIIEGCISNSNLDISFVPFAKREFVIMHIDIDENMTVECIIDIIVNKLQNHEFHNLYRIILEGLKDKDITLDINYIKNRLEEHVIYTEIIDKTTPNYDLDKLRKENANNVIGKFIEHMESDIEDAIYRQALYEGIEALLSEKVN